MGMTQMDEYTKPLTPSEIRRARNELLDITVELMEVAGGSFITCQARRGHEHLFAFTKISAESILVRRAFHERCIAYGARLPQA